MFNIGDKIVYPMHGAGIIESIEEKEVLGQKKKYYIMRIPIGNMKVMIPMDKVADFGIRNIVGYDEFQNIMKIFRECDNNTFDNWNKRYRYNIDKIRNGSIYGMAEVVKELTLREIRKGISPGEKKILDNAKQILYSELVLVTDLKYEEIENIIKDIIAL